MIIKRLNEKMQSGRSGDKEIPVSSWRKFSRLIKKNIDKKDYLVQGMQVQKIYLNL